MNARVAIALLVAVGCRSGEQRGPAQSASSVAGGRAAAPASASASSARADASAPTETAAAPAEGSSGEPLLAAELEHDTVAVLLEPAEQRRRSAGAPDPNGDAGTLTVYARGPIITIGEPLDASALSPEARAHLAPTYGLRTREGRACTGARVAVARVHRIPDSDPTVSRDPGESDPTWAKRMYALAGDGGASHVAIVKTSHCPGVVVATPSDFPQPTVLRVAPLAAAEKKRVRTALANAEGYEAAKRESPSGDPPLEALAIGDALVWARAEGTTYAAPNACFVLSRRGATFVVTASTPMLSMCPPEVRGATRGPNDDLRVWFPHARALVAKDAIEVAYFPTAWFGIAGSP